MEILNFRSKHQYQASALGIELPITISVGAHVGISLLAKVDTGATFCIFQREYADALGIEVEGGLAKIVATPTGSFEAYGHTVKLSCFEYEFDSVVYFARHYEFHRNVLGLQGWLDKLRFGLVHHEASLFLSHYDD
ncbi:MAG: hypothetical protein ACR2JB_19865 [Bryobacteraceae bacterium]